MTILAAVLLATHQFAVQPLLLSYQDNQAQNRQLPRAAAALSAHWLPRSLGLLVNWPCFESDVETSMAYLEGANDALAAAALQDLVVDAVDMTGGDVRSIRSLPVVDIEERPELRRTGVQIRFAADIGSLAETLHDLETMEPRLFVDRLEILAANARRTKNGARHAEPQLDVRIDVHGYVRLQP